MKKHLFTVLLFASLSLCSNAQNPKLAVLKIDNQVRELQNENLTELVRIQLAKFKKYEVMDRYEIAEGLARLNIDMENCFSLSCLLEAGKSLQAEKVVSGSLDKLGETLFIRIRLVDIKTGSVEKEVIKEFLFLPSMVNTMLTIGLNDLMGVENDKNLEKSLSSSSSYESAVNNPHYSTLSLSGPRMGYTFFTGDQGKNLRKPKDEGGYDVLPALFQFGYQFEKQYLSEGKLQALFEFIPLITGLDQGMFIPSLTFMNGIRSNVTGFEFAIGPTFSFIREGWYVKNTEGEYVFDDGLVERHPDGSTTRKMDSRGDLVAMKTSVAIALGYSFKSGRLKIPVNAFFVPGKNGNRFGISFGFNAKKE